MHGTFDTKTAVDDPAELEAAIDALMAPAAPARQFWISRRDVRGIDELGLDGVTRFHLVDSDEIYQLANIRGAKAARPRWNWLIGSVREGSVRTDNMPWVAGEANWLHFEIRAHAAAHPAGKLWMVWRRPYGRNAGEREILTIDDIPILFIDPKVARVMAQLCSHPLQPESDCLRWVPLSKWP